MLLHGTGRQEVQRQEAHPTTAPHLVEAIKHCPTLFIVAKITGNIKKKQQNNVINRS